MTLVRSRYVRFLVALLVALLVGAVVRVLGASGGWNPDLTMLAVLLIVVALSGWAASGHGPSDQVR